MLRQNESWAFSPPAVGYFFFGNSGGVDLLFNNNTPRRAVNLFVRRRPGGKTAAAATSKKAGLVVAAGESCFLLERQHNLVEMFLGEVQRALVVYAALHYPQELVPRRLKVALLLVAYAEVLVAHNVHYRL